MPYQENITNRPLRVFLCHSSNDKPLVRELYQKLRAETWIQPWLDEEELYPGQDWETAIEKAVEESDAVLVCLSNNSITKRGFVQRELRFVLDIALEIPEESIFIIPLRLEECHPPRSLQSYQYADYFPEAQRGRAFDRLLVSLKKRADSLGLRIEVPASKKESKPDEKTVGEKKSIVDTPTLASNKESKPVQDVAFKRTRTLLDALRAKTDKRILGNMEFMRVPAGKFLMGSTKENILANDDERPQHTVDIPYDYWMARFPITNEGYNKFITAKGLEHPVSNWMQKKDHPITYVKRIDAIAYCQWLNKLLKNELPSGLVLRLPTEAEWEKAARGTSGIDWPWGNEFDKNKCNSSEGGKGATTPVGSYSPQGDSPYGCTDMVGNVWEWTHSLFKPYPYQANDGREDENHSDPHVLRGGAFLNNEGAVRCAARLSYRPNYGYNFFVGFRVVFFLA